MSQKCRYIDENWALVARRPAEEAVGLARDEA